MSLAPRGFGYDAACVIFVKGFCCEGVEEKAGNLKQPLLGVCKAILVDATSPGKPFGLLCSLPLLSTALWRDFLLAGVSPPVLTWGVSQHCCLQRLTLLKLDVQKSLCISPGVAEGLCQKPESMLRFFLYEGCFSQANFLALLAVLEDYIVSPSIKGKAIS